MINKYRRTSAKILFIIISFFVLHKEVFAVQGFSRACNLLSIKQQYPVTYPTFFDFFQLAGMSFSDRLMLSSISDTELSKYWINESFTADTINIPRYYLFARNAVRSKPIAVVGAGTTGTLVQNFESPSWTAFKINPAKLTGTILNQIGYRHLGFFARAGHPGIIQRFNDSNLRYEVEGQHAYYEPIEKTTQPLLGSFAKDCNFGWSWAWL